MNKKFLVLPLAGVCLFASVLASSNVINSTKAEEVLMDVDSIQALSHKDGAMVHFMNDNMRKMWETDLDDIQAIKDLFEYNTDLKNYANIIGDRQTVRLYYEMYDDFKPVNNVLTWKSKLDAKNFDIVVSLNDELTEVVYEQKGLTTMEYEMENPMINQHYYWQVTANTKNGEKVKSRVFDFVNEDYSRTIDVSGVSNSRDIGGLTTSFGTIKQGLVYRTARLDDIDSKGIETLNKLQIQTDLDIRNLNEGAQNPAHLPNYYLRTLQNYFVALQPANRSTTIDAMREFVNPDNYPIMYHCTVGKDRTGTLTFLLLGLMGASEDYLMRDYSNTFFAVTGASHKDLDDLNFGTARQTLDGIKNFKGASFAEQVESFLLPQVDAVTGEMVGLTKDEIQQIRDILTGKIEVSHAPKTKIAEENYAGKCFATFKAVGHKDVVKLIDKGTKVTAPYALSSEMDWYINGQKWDPSMAINESALIVADYKTEYVITMHFIGIDKEDEYKYALENEEIRFDDYELEGYNLLVLSDLGTEISKLKVNRNAVINLMYTKK